MPEQDRDDVTYLMLRGMVLRRLPEHRSDAERSLRRAVELEPERSDAHYNLANLLLDCDAFGEAEHGFRRCLALASDAPLAWHNLGISLTNQERFDEARPVLQTSPPPRPMVPQTPGAILVSPIWAAFLTRQRNVPLR